jgi:hypothetical protein
VTELNALLMRFLDRSKAMSVLSITVTSWIALNGAVAAALLARRSRPELRERLFRWVIHGETKRRSRASHAHSRPSRV